MNDLAYLFPDIEGAYVRVIRAQVRVDSATIVPDPRPEEFVQVARVGGTTGMVVDNPRVTFFVWAPTWGAAQELTQLVRQRVMSVFRLDTNIVVYDVEEVGGIARAPDSPDGSPCYQFTIQTKLRGSRA